MLFPKRRYGFKDPSDSRFASSALLSVFFGLAAGGVGMLMAVAYTDIPLAISPGLTAPAGVPRTVIDFPRAPERDISRSAVRLYSAGQRIVRNYGTFLLAPGALGAGIVLTSDGWVITHESALAGGEPETAVVGERSHAILDRVIDPYSGIVFLKVDGTNLPVTPFGRETVLAPGDQLFGLDAGGGVRRVEVLAVDTPPLEDAADLVRSSERMQRMPRTTSGVGMLPGAILTDEKGEVAAIYAGESTLGGLIVPIGAFMRQVSPVLRDGEASRPYLGVRYIDLAGAVDAIDGSEAGALLSASADGRFAAVIPGSPAASAGLRAGDIITTVNGDRVTRSNPLPELLAVYAPEETVTLDVLRNGQALGVEVVLGKVPAAR